MSNPYRDLFAAPGTGGFTLAGLLARLPLPMTGIGIITLLSQTHGSYALAGAVAATFVLSYALLSPQISAWVDRYGQRRVLPPAVAVGVIGMLILLATSTRQHLQAGLFAGAVLAGFMPSMSAMVRARWTAIYRGQARLQTAYSLETVLDETSFIVGPPLAVGLAVMMFPQAGLLAAALLLVLGTAMLVAQRRTEPAAQVPALAATPRRSLIGLASVRLLTLLMVAMGVIVGTVDIVSVAFATQLGQPAAASIVLSAYAVGSCLAGLLFGALKLRTPLRHLLLLGALATALSIVPLLRVQSIPALAAAVLVAGLFFAPTLIVAMSLLERQVPEQRLTEAMTWLLAGLNTGVALGAAAAGRIIDGNDAAAGFAVTACAAVLVLLIALYAHRHLRSPLPALHSTT